MPSLRRATYIGLLMASLVFIASGTALAAEEVLQTNIGESGSWESNPLMLINGARALYGSTTSPELIFSDNTPTIKFSADTLVNENLFNLSNFDSTDVHETVSFNDQPTPRWTYGAQAKVDYDTTRTSEPANFNAVTSPVRHLGIAGTPQISFNPTPVDKFALTGTAQTSQYDNNTSFQDYNLYSVDPTYTRAIDPLDSAIAGVEVQRYITTSGLATRTDAISPSIGWQKSLTPRLSATASVGPQFSRQVGGGISTDWQLSYNFSADVTYKGIQDTTDFIASRNQYPFANGSDALSTILSVTEKHAINALLTANIGGVYQTADYPTTPGPLSFNSQITGNAGLTYHATEHVDVNGSYQYRYETFTGTSLNAQDNLVMVGVALASPILGQVNFPQTPNNNHIYTYCIGRARDLILKS